MENLKIVFAESRDLDDIVTLSHKFAQEKCCNGIVADEKENYSGKTLAAAKIGETIVGYCYGSIEVKERDAGRFRKGQKSFYVEELYVDGPHRNRGVGRALFRFMEHYAEENGCDYIETTAVSKNYKSLLSFYAEQLDMEFWSAEMIKKIKK